MFSDGCDATVREVATGCTRLQGSCSSKEHWLLVAGRALLLQEVAGGAGKAQCQGVAVLATALELPWVAWRVLLFQSNHNRVRAPRQCLSTKRQSAHNPLCPLRRFWPA